MLDRANIYLSVNAAARGDDGRWINVRRQKDDWAADSSGHIRDRINVKLQREEFLLPTLLRSGPLII